MNHQSLSLIALAALAFSCTTRPASDSRMDSTPNVRVEPSNWWVGMHEPDVQLLVRADGVGATQPVLLHAAGARLAEVYRTDNSNYIFVTLDLADVSSPDTLCIAFQKGDSVKHVVNYPLLARREGSANRQGFSSADAVYLAMPDRFANAIPSNDDMPGMLQKADRNEPYGRHGGDLQGIIDHLDYIHDLGMTALWLTPVLENNMPASSYHGYAITDYYNVDARFGSNDDFVRLSAELHKRGMKSIMDMVFNHCGTGHWWMNDLPCKDWINVWEQGFVRSNYRLAIVRDNHASQSDRDLTLRGWFDTSMPDMNLDNPLVLNYLVQNSIWWIETADLDGIRQDTYPYSNPQAMAEWNIRVAREYPNFNIVGEIWITDEAKIATWQKDAANADGFNSQLPTVMDFPLQNVLCEAVREDYGGEKLYDHFGDDFLFPNPSNILVFGENHDTGRLFTMLHDDDAAMRMAYGLIATVRGIPQVYYGSEALFTGKGWEGHCNIRQDFPGGWQGDAQDFFTAMPEREKAMHDFTARLFNFRKSSEALCHGDMIQYQPKDNIYTFFRRAQDGKKVMVLLNPSKADVSVALSRFVSDGLLESAKLQGTDVCSGSSITATDSLLVAARSIMVIDLQ